MSKEINILLKKINEKLDVVLENFNLPKTKTIEEDPDQTHFSWYKDITNTHQEK